MCVCRAYSLIVSHSSLAQYLFCLFAQTTQVSKLVSALQERGRHVEAMRFPQRSTSIGSVIDSYLSNRSDLDHRVIHLLFSANRWEACKHVEDTLAAGVSIVCDRYAYSGIAYSVAKGLDYDWCRACDVGLPKPDVTCYLQLPVRVAASRSGFGNERHENADFQRRVRWQFEYFLKSNRSWQAFDATLPIDALHERLLQAVERLLANVDTIGPLSRIAANCEQPLSSVHS